MKIEIKPPCPLHMFGAENIKFELRSVAVWVIVQVNGESKYFLAVQQGDKPGEPWGIPAGWAKKTDNSPKEVGLRELREETGLEVDADQVEYLNWYWDKPGARRGDVIYGCLLSIDVLDIRNSETLDDGTIIFNPPCSVDKSEIPRLALVPLNLAFEKNILTHNPYHFPETYQGLKPLRRAGIVAGRFSFERDPYLFDD